MATVDIKNLQKDLQLSLRTIRRFIKLLFDHLNLADPSCAIYFVSEKRIAELHRQFFNDPSPTDCISFPIDLTFLGEIFVCPKTALRYAEKRHKDPLEETALYVAHGLLHLIGYDDLDPLHRRAMRKKEKECMAIWYKMAPQ